MKKLFVLVLAMLLCMSVAVIISAAEIPFKDVAKDTWYYESVGTAYEMKLINGKGATDTYKPDDNMTYAEAIKLAACMNQLHTKGAVTLENGTVNWYDTYVEYCKTNGIIKKDYNMNEKATRAGYMEIFAKALPDSALEQINNVPDNFIPDVKMDASYAAAVYKLYRAGILAGVDEKNNCAPASNIKRSEVAVILTRMMVKEKRVAVGPAPTLKLSHTNITLAKGETIALKATVGPSNAEDKSVVWTSSDTSVAAVTNGEVTAIKAGRAVITAKWGDKSVTCNVVVYYPVKIGDYIKFGRYEQDNNTENGMEEIEWRVLDIKDGHALVISKYVLDSQPYNEHFYAFSPITWRYCSLRKWLNNDFLNTAFTDSEKAIIPTVTVSTEKNPQFKTDGGHPSQDKVFLLSINEASSYFSLDEDITCEPTAFAKGKGIWTSETEGIPYGKCNWRLRSPGLYRYYIAIVCCDGRISYIGEGTTYNGAIRPAMWIDLTLYNPID